jgi:hypothetical protein
VIIFDLRIKCSFQGSGKANSKKGKKGPAVRIDNGELLTSTEARERRAVRSAELQEKQDAKVVKDVKKAEKEQAEAT